jgi:hypothetical protein
MVGHASDLSLALRQRAALTRGSQKNHHLLRKNRPSLMWWLSLLCPLRFRVPAALLPSPFLELFRPQLGFRGSKTHSPCDDRLGTLRSLKSPLGACKPSPFLQTSLGRLAHSLWILGVSTLSYYGRLPCWLSAQKYRFVRAYYPPLYSVGRILGARGNLLDTSMAARRRDRKSLPHARLRGLP